MKITISGNPGSGKSTLAKHLAQKFNLKFYSMGNLRRKMAIKEQIDINELNKIGEKDYRTDREVDNFLKKLTEKDNIIVDGRMAFHFIPDSIKVFVKVDLKEGAKRIIGRKGKSESYKNVDEACLALNRRMESDKKRYMRYYHVNVFEINHYDIVMDSTEMPLKEAKKNISKSVEKFIKK